MPTADLALRDEYAAAVERLAGHTLDALRGAGGAVAPAPAFPGTGPVPRPVLAAARVLGPDVLAPQALGATGPDEQAVLLLAEAHRAFPPSAFPAAATTPPSSPDEERAAGAALVTAWRDWGTAVLLARALGPAADAPLPGATDEDAGADTGLGAPRPGHAPHPEPYAWQAWSVRMAQLSALALPGLDGPVHDAAREHSLALSRGAVRSLLRCDHRVAARLTRWLAWLAADGRELPLEVEPMLERIRSVGDGSARTALELAVAERLLTGGTS
ncbi:hypothetical protein [Kitasatospora purpeofusca]|uniref:hypothetical protein n=1 Tax=Kitasatospora purpeofusca TaxID=67352 RepID=UPI002251F088|nr:hypothetical protein [Kitasatospora purpeofusca]MCX4756770.1 hypothetical protein [Kitasatospora purpeofusca]WSR35446.1 hypothetical protein OG715_33480 [Kitasatospora purpeofusca]WSR43765.1 hypothetical protein OG196_34520 [Kitasatospora purpeofusca]